MFSSKDLFFTPAAGGYTVSKSLRFRASASAYLNRTFGTPTNNKIWTWSGWVKIGKIATDMKLFSTSVANTPFSSFYIDGNANLSYYEYTGSNYVLTSSQVFRDPSAWYHIAIAMDTTQATSSNRTKFYVNGVQITSSGSYVPQSTNTALNSAIAAYIGQAGNSSGYYDGYLAEVNFIDGQALDPTYFGSYDTNGIWQPKAYSGSGYGNNGFYLKFTDVGTTSGSNTGYGKDFAGTNYWTTNNFGTTSTATTYDSMLDSPNNATGDIGNYAVLNPLANYATLSNANLTAASSDTSNELTSISTILVNSGKWYAEFTVATASGTIAAQSNIAVGSVIPTAASSRPSSTTNGVGYRKDGQKEVAGTASAYGASWAAGNVIGVALDCDTNQVTFYKDNASQGAISINSGVAYFICSSLRVVSGTSSVDVNFGQRPFAYTPPSGYSALNTQNLTTPTITNGAAYMAAVTYTGTGSSQTITASSTNSGNNPNGTTFQPDLVWVKGRSGATDHALYDAVRGVQLQLESNTTTAETTETTGLTAFTSSGFTTGALAQMNTNTATYVAWEWNAGGSNATNTSGSITSTVRANTSAGFSIVTYTGTGANATVGHGLGVAPSMIIVKCRSAAKDWLVYHSSVGNTATLFLNSTQAIDTNSAYWNNTSPTSSVFSLGTSLAGNTSSATQVAYCFAPVSGYSAFGSYTGNGSTDGPFIYMGFRPRYLLIKMYSGAVGQSWSLHDTSRSPYNVDTLRLQAESSNAENNSTSNSIDILSNGFKIRTIDNEYNNSSYSYVYAAFAENPFKISRAR